MRRKFDDEDEKRPGWFWRFVRGVIYAVLVSAAAVAVLSIYVLPPPPPPVVEESPAGPEVVGGIEVSDAPAYSNPAATDETGDAGSGETADPSAGAPPPPETGTLQPVELDGPAISVNAQPFEAEPGVPLVAVVLDDTAANPMLHQQLFALDLPLTVGVIAGGGGDQVTAEAAFAAGFEVVAQLPLTAQGQSGGAGLEFGLPEAEAAERTLTLMQRLPMALGASRPLSATAPPNNTVLVGVLSALSPLGFAYLDHGVTIDQGSGAAAAAMAMRGEDGLGGIVGVSRYAIPAGASAAEVIAVLDKAATAEGGGAVVIAAPGEELMLALQLWGGGGSGAQARLAPLSAVIRRQNGG